MQRGVLLSRGLVDVGGLLGHSPRSGMSNKALKLETTAQRSPELPNARRVSDERSACDWQERQGKGNIGSGRARLRFLGGALARGPRSLVRVDAERNHGFEHELGGGRGLRWRHAAVAEHGGYVGPAPFAHERSEWQE